VGWWCSRSSQFSKCRPAGHGPTEISVCGVSGAQVGYSSCIDIVVLAPTQTLQARSHLSSEPHQIKKCIPSTYSSREFVQVIPPATTTSDYGPPFPSTTNIKIRKSHNHSHRTSSQLSTPPTPNDENLVQSIRHVVREIGWRNVLAAAVLTGLEHALRMEMPMGERGCHRCMIMPQESLKMCRSSRRITQHSSLLFRWGFYWFWRRRRWR
jgi:hypothetical protein